MSSTLIVSSSDPANYRGKVLNYRCRSSHTAGADTKPGVGASWRQFWEYAAVYRLRIDKTLIPRLVSLVKDGFVPWNPVLAAAGEGGTFIGAQQLTVSKLDLTLTGSGGGSVHAGSQSTASIACVYPSQAGPCSTTQPRGTMLHLVASADTNSLFGGWGGDCRSCSGLTCDVTLNGAMMCSASFTFSEPVRITGVPPHYFATLGEACTYTVSGDIVDARQFTFTENLALDSPQSITIRGGFDPSYEKRDGMTLLSGTLAIVRGEVVLDRLAIRQRLLPVRDSLPSESLLATMVVLHLTPAGYRLWCGLIEQFIPD